MRGRVLAGVLSAVVVSPATGATIRANAQTAGANDCVITATWTFTPALSTTTVANGTASFTYTVTCVNLQSCTTPGVPPTYSTTGAVQSNYNGNCELAFLSDSAGRSGIIVGGVNATYVLPFPSSFVLVPANPCNDAGPTPSDGVSVLTSATP